jgi:hypothetical protein
VTLQNYSERINNTNKRGIRLIFLKKLYNPNNTHISSNNSTIIGFIPASNIEHLEEIIYTLEPVCDDWENEISDGVYETKNQLRIKVLCDETTVRA